VAKGLKSSTVTDHSLVRQMRIMNAKIEELQQDQIQSKKAAANREKMVEKHLKAREITTLKRKRCDSCSSEGPSNSSSAPKLTRKTNTATQKKPPQATKQAEMVLTAEALRKAIEEVKKVEIDNSKEGIFQASLSARG
jgi:hypothetical protein